MASNGTGQEANFFALQPPLLRNGTALEDVDFLHLHRLLPYAGTGSLSWLLAFLIASGRCSGTGLPGGGAVPSA